MIVYSAYIYLELSGLPWPFLARSKCFCLHSAVFAMSFQETRTLHYSSPRGFAVPHLVRGCPVWTLEFHHFCGLSVLAPRLPFAHSVGPLGPWHGCCRLFARLADHRVLAAGGRFLTVPQGT